MRIAGARMTLIYTIFAVVGWIWAIIVFGLIFAPWARGWRQRNIDFINDDFRRHHHR
jgi:hypothetical protein